MIRTIGMLLLIVLVLAACAPVDLNAPIPTYDTGISPEAWATIPAGEFLAGQFDVPAEIPYDYEMMVTDVTVAQYVVFLNEALSGGTLQVGDAEITVFYPGDIFRGARHELEIAAGQHVVVPTTDPASRFTFDGQIFHAVPGYENHPMTNVSWFGALAYCDAHGWRLPTELEWEKAARGTTGWPFPWGEEIARNQANFQASRDPFEDMRILGSRTSPVGFYNGKTYDGYTTLDGASPYGLYDMAGNVWQWTADVYEDTHLRFMRGGSKDCYEMDLRVWASNNAVPSYYGPGVGFRCVRTP